MVQASLCASCQINKIKSNFAALARHVFALKQEEGGAAGGMEKLCGSSVKVPAKTFSSAKFSLGK